MFNNANNLILDWFGFTFKPHAPHTWDELYELTDTDNPVSCFHAFFPELDNLFTSARAVKMKSHYDTNLELADGILVMFINPKETQDISEDNHRLQLSEYLGVNIQIPSHGVSEFMQLLCCADQNNNLDFIMLNTLIHNRFCQFSRIDLAFDDYDKKYTPQMLDTFANGLIDPVTCERDKKTICMRSNMRSRHLYKKTTFYMGDRHHGKLYRCYDKNVESHGRINAIRHEFELHREYAESFMDYFCENIDTFTFYDYVCSNWYVIVDRSTCPSNISLCEIDKNWADYCRNADSNLNLTHRLQTSTPKYNPDELLIRRKEWLENCKSAITELYIQYGDEWLFSQILDLTPHVINSLTYRSIKYHYDPKLYWDPKDIVNIHIN